jgi:hypothetical protein
VKLFQCGIISLCNLLPGICSLQCGNVIDLVQQNKRGDSIDVRKVGCVIDCVYFGPTDKRENDEAGYDSDRNEGHLAANVECPYEVHGALLKK